MEKKNILIATSGYYPGVKNGGIVTSRENFAEALDDIYNIYIVTKNHDYRTTQSYENIIDGWNTRKNTKILYLKDEECNTEQFRKIFDEVNPEFIYASGTITSYFSFNKPIFSAAKKLNIPVILTPDGDICTEALRIKPLKKYIAIMICKLLNAFKDIYFQVTLEEEKNNLKKYFNLSDDRITLLPNFPCIINARKNYIKEKNTLRIIFSSRISRIKNLDKAISLVCQLKTNTIFDIYGPLEDASYWEECQLLIKKAPKNVKITYRGSIDPSISKEVYKIYDVFLLLTKSENYCYAIEESLLCGCPVLISKGSTPWDDVHKKAGFAIPLDNLAKFIDCLEYIGQMDDFEYQIFTSGIKDYIENKVNLVKLKKRYTDMFNNYLNDYKG